MKSKNMFLRNQLSMMPLLFGILVFFAVWAAFFEIDQAVRSQGQVIAVSRTQIIQVADGGVLSELRVAEGQQVKVGEVLAVLEKSRAQAGFEESRDRVAALEVALIRAKAEARLIAPVFESGHHAHPEFVRAQQRLYLQRRKSLDEERSAVSQALSMAQEELSMNEALLKDGDVSRIEMLRARRQVTDLKGKAASLTNKYQQDASAEAAKIEEELASFNSKMAERKSVLDHTDLTAPVAGVIKYLRVTTIGGVLKAGDELMQIAPTENDLAVEAKVYPADIGLLRLGLPVAIKVDAFDYSIYGMLDGELTYISPDTLSEQGANGQTQTYYRVRARIAPPQAGNDKTRQISVKPGMTVSIDIRTGTRSVLGYLGKPLSRAFSGAMNER